MKQIMSCQLETKESQFMILTNSSMKKDFSPQDVVSYSDYAQGFKGGFNYLKDFDVVGVLPLLGRDSNVGRNETVCVILSFKCSTKYK